MRTAALGLVVVIGLGLALGAAPAGAIETATFGIDVATPTPDGRLHIPITAGSSNRAELRVFNKSDAPLALQLSVAPAIVDETGSSSVGGDDEAAGWAAVEPSRVDLGPGEERRVAVVVAAPDRLSGEIHTIAVVAEPAAGAERPAVLQRLAVTVFLEPDGPSFVERLGWWPWLGGLLLAAVIAATAARRNRFRPGPATT